ncbi:hypothetical protein TBLA_0C00270 [Henningerozyma blattae CBS 6284]|uniref:NAD-dependent epimerase/dehydratase domain-containing protein n=1 Tax=Henningerozyma blattae (strain ATCC 34711 / CBS 6284 / DSM 70876 / NBRC 10599 / NRRL Y-10934 / UCD 77-7) TaxID=1071380 RepID=I2H0E2_HENB6|nr:hypothetical protein TBLA_0C00270 [Tetrapisispora blattae CBS 6284]CCH59844.1 hypothetical protein TBLA_0C00270 [Tetrapisispora blattae CBS 6284]
MTVLVSGATGFIAQHVVDSLLKASYKVIGTARTPAKAAKLLEQFGHNSNLSMEVVPDISNIKGFDKVFEKHGKNINIVLHTASPFPFNITQFEKDLLIPARNGTRGILESIKKYSADTVERVVVTSSFASIWDFEAAPNRNFVYNEKMWNPAIWESAQTSAIMAYCASKKFAEETAWNFLHEYANKINFKLTTVNPVYVFGPQMFKSNVKETLNTSCEIINKVLKSNPREQLSLEIPGEFIDVRDIAKAHLAAFQKKETIGKRLLMSNGAFSEQTICNLINEEFPQLQGKIAPWAKDIKLDTGDVPFSIDNTMTRKLLEWDFIPIEKSVTDTVSQIIEAHK